MKQLADSSILYVEDDAIAREQIALFLKTQCKTVYTASNGYDAFELYKRHKPDVIISDIEMPRLNGIELARKVRNCSLSTQIIIVTAHKNPEYLIEAVNLQLTQYIIKPLSIDKITTALDLTSNFLDGGTIDVRKSLTHNKYYDTYTKELFHDKKVIRLSKHERNLLELFIKKHPAPVSYESIDTNIYDNESSKNAIKLLISALRIKIDKTAISNISGFGYKLNIRNSP